MTVWVVILNTVIEGVFGTREAAGAKMDAIMASPKFMGDAWRPMGEDGWASRSVTRLVREPYQVTW